MRSLALPTRGKRTLDLRTCGAKSLFEVSSTLGATMDDHAFTVVEKDEVGLGYCVIVQRQDGRRECVTGFGDKDQAEQWIRLEAPGWLLDAQKKAK